LFFICSCNRNSKTAQPFPETRFRQEKRKCEKNGKDYFKESLIFSLDRDFKLPTAKRLPFSGFPQTEHEETASPRQRSAIPRGSNQLQLRPGRGVPFQEEATSYSFAQAEECHSKGKQPVCTLTERTYDRITVKTLDYV
jgi:hypothetical protein